MNIIAIHIKIPYISKKIETNAKNIYFSQTNNDNVIKLGIVEPRTIIQSEFIQKSNKFVHIINIHF